MKGKSKIVYHRSKCIGCGACYERQPGQWRMSRKDGKANLIASTTNKRTQLASSFDSFQILDSVAKACPARAIRIITLNTVNWS